jgi:hypothetical protein
LTAQRRFRNTSLSSGFFHWTDPQIDPGPWRCDRSVIKA